MDDAKQSLLAEVSLQIHVCVGKSALILTGRVWLPTECCVLWCEAKKRLERIFFLAVQGHLTGPSANDVSV